ncbi:LicD family protein [Parapedobacter sp.]
MNNYVIRRDGASHPVPFIKTSAKEAVIPNIPIKTVDHDFFCGTYGVRITDYEIDNYQAHFNVWHHFMGSGEEVCMVMEEGVHMNISEEDLEAYFADMGDEWDVFFPYDKVSADGRKDVLEVSASKFGFFWGSYCYIMHRRGVQKMIALDTIIQPVDEELVRQSFSGHINTSFSKTDWFEYDESESPSYLARNRSVREAIFKHSAWSEETKRDAVAIMKYLSDVAEEMGVDLFLHAGTLLGGVRHGGIMPWDDDIDLMMNAADIDAFMERVEQEGYVESCTWTWPKTNQTYYKFWFKTGQKAEGFPYLFPFVDIWVFFDKGYGKVETCDGYFLSHATFFPPKPIVFEGCRLKLPNNYKTILDIKYKGWKTRIKVYVWSHRVKASVFKPMSLAIEVDETGRML